MAKIIRFKTKNVTLGEALDIVKTGLEDPTIHPHTKLIAMQKVSEMETRNSITKTELIGALRYIFSRYDFPEED